MTPTWRSARKLSRSCFVIVSDTAPSLQLLGQRPELLHLAADLSAALVEDGLFDHLVRPPQHRRRDRQAEGLGRLEVDHELELQRLRHGQVAGPCSLEDLDVISTLASSLASTRLAPQRRRAKPL